MSRTALPVLVLLAIVACARDAAPKPAAQGAMAAADAPSAAQADSIRADSIARARQDSINRTLPGYVIDSILPVEEMLRRFRAAVGGSPVTALQNASDSRDALVSRFMTAVAQSDSIELRRMVLNAREFADLVYPESPNTRPPYRQDPGLVWRTIQNPSAMGFTRLLRRTKDIPARLIDYSCRGRSETQGKNTFYAGCFLRLADAKGKVSEHRYFGSIIEREGKFKFMSYRNEF